MGEASYKIPGGKLVKVKLHTKRGRISSVVILGDFFLHPEETLRAIEVELVGLLADEKAISDLITQKLADAKATLIGATADDMAKTIMMAWDSM
ncbi:MAG: lipoate protein ligase C-terminal domain-containing protein [Candidatus Thorarchaeota archaeon]